MKKSILIIVVAVFVIAFSSCKSPDEEIYNPECKISKIWYRSDVGNPNEVYHYDGGGNLLNIDIDSAESFLFSHNKDKTISKIVHVGKNYTEIIDMTYLNRLVHKIFYTVDDTIRQIIIFGRDNETNRITSAIELYDRDFFDRFAILHKSQLYNAFIGDIQEVHKIISAAPSKNLIIRCEKTFEYAPGKKEKYENLAQVVEKYPDLLQEITRTYTYNTDIYNPFYGLPYAYAGYAGYFLNSKLTEHSEIKTAGTVTRTIDISYNYNGIHYLNDKNYPRQFITTSSENNNIPIHTYILYVK